MTTCNQSRQSFLVYSTGLFRSHEHITWALDDRKVGSRAEPEEERAEVCSNRHLSQLHPRHDLSGTGIVAWGG